MSSNDWSNLLDNFISRKWVGNANKPPFLQGGVRRRSSKLAAELNNSDWFTQAAGRRICLA